MRARLRSVHQMQAAAAATPPAAPAASEVHDTCSVNAVVPTASTHHVPSAVMIRDAYPTAPSDPDHAADDREQQPFVQEQPSHRRRLEADRPQQSHFARALFHAELEEQRDQQQRGHDQEETEVDEVLAEVRAPRGRRQAFRPHIADRQARCQRIDPRAQALLDLFAGLLAMERLASGGVARMDVSAPYRDRQRRWPASSGTNAFGVVR